MFAFVPLNWDEKFKGPALRSPEKRKETGREWRKRNFTNFKSL